MSGSKPTKNNSGKYDQLTICLAGHIIAVRSYGSTLNRKYFKKYLANSAPDQIEHTVTIERNLINGHPFGNGNPSGFFLIHQDISDWLLTKNVLTLHAASLTYRKKAYLFSAPSGTGKSTHARLWRKAYGNEVRIISGDQPLIRIDKNGASACGSIWNGKEHLGNNIESPIGAICVLSRSETNSIARLSPLDALISLSTNIYIPTDPSLASVALGLLQELVLTVPVYALACNMQIDAAEFARDSIVE